MDKETRELLSKLKKLRLDQQAELLAAFSKIVANRVDQAEILPPGPSAHIETTRAAALNLLRVLKSQP